MKKGTARPVYPDPQAELALIRKGLKHFTEPRAVRYWLDVGSPRLHSVLGSRSVGIPYGKPIEISGFESHGKTALALLLARYAQRDGAEIAWMDFEDSWDDEWAEKRGVDPKRVMLFQRQLMVDPKKKKLPELQTSEALFTEAEIWMQKRYRRNPEGRLFLAVDSAAAIMPQEEQEAGAEEQNMRTKLALTAFLTQQMKRWTALAAAFNVMLVVTNQLRVSPGVKFGDPVYTPGGNALRFYCGIRARIRRVKGGKLLQDGKLVGIKGALKNIKNKAGRGSEEGEQIGFKMYRDGRWKFVPLADVKLEGEEAAE